MSKFTYDPGSLTDRERQFVRAIRDLFMSQTTHFLLLLRAVEAIRQKREPDLGELVGEAAEAAQADLLKFMTERFPDLNPRITA